MKVSYQEKFKENHANTEGLKKSTIPNMKRMLNNTINVKRNHG